MNTDSFHSGSSSSTPESLSPSSALRDAAYDQIDRFLRNNLNDVDYADYSQALDLIYTTSPACKTCAGTGEVEFLVGDWPDSEHRTNRCPDCTTSPNQQDQSV